MRHTLLAVLFLSPSLLLSAQESIGGGISQPTARTIRFFAANPAVCSTTVGNIGLNTTTDLLQICVDTNTWAALPSVASKLSAFAATTSAELAGVLTNETGTGNVVYSDAPALTGTWVWTHTGAPLSVTRDDATTGGVSTLGTFTHSTTGTAAPGIGTTFIFRTEDASGSNNEMGRFSIVAEDVTDTSEDAFWSYAVTVAGNSTERARIGGTGIKSKAGTSATFVTAGGTECSSVTSTGNVGAGEDDLLTCSTETNMFANDFESYDLVAAGTFAANGNNKRIRVRAVENANNTVLVDTGAIAANAADWSIRCTFTRATSTTFKSGCTVITSSALLVATADYVTGTFTFANAGTIKLTGEATSNNDIVQETMRGEWKGTP